MYKKECNLKNSGRRLLSMDVWNVNNNAVT